MSETPESTYPQLPPGSNWPGVPEPGAAAPTPKSRRPLILAGLAVVVALAASAIYFLKPDLSSIFGETGPITLTYWGVSFPDEVMKPILADYQTAHPNVTINYEKRSLAQYRETLSTRLQDGSGPDIFEIHNTWLPIFENNQTDELSPATAYSSADMESNFYPSVKEDLVYNGRYYGVPLAFDGLALLYNDQLFQAAGIAAPPQTWTEIRLTYAPKLTKYNPDGSIAQAGIALGTSGNVDYFSDILGLLMLQNGVKMTDGSAVTFDTSTSADGRNQGTDALDFYTLFAKREFSDRGPVWSSRLPASTEAFISGQAAMILVPAARIPDILTRVGSSFTVKAAPAPQPVASASNPVYWASYWAEAVSRDTKAKNTAWDLVKFLSAKETVIKLIAAQKNLNQLGFVPSRVDLAQQFSADPYLGAYLTGAQAAHSWYLASGTGDNALNDPIAAAFGGAVTDAVTGKSPSADALKVAAQTTSEVLAKYGLAIARPKPR